MPIKIEELLKQLREPLVRVLDAVHHAGSDLLTNVDVMKQAMIDETTLTSLAGNPQLKGHFYDVITVNPVYVTRYWGSRENIRKVEEACQAERNHKADEVFGLVKG